MRSHGIGVATVTPLPALGPNLGTPKQNAELPLFAAGYIPPTSVRPPYTSVVFSPYKLLDNGRNLVRVVYSQHSTHEYSTGHSLSAEVPGKVGTGNGHEIVLDFHHRCRLERIPKFQKNVTRAFLNL